MLDTRLRNNKRALRLAVFIVMLAAACFAYVAAFYKFRVDDYCAEIGSGFEEEGFISILMQSNFVLYPEVIEKSGKDVALEDLYLSFSEVPAGQETEVEYFENMEEYTSSEQFRSYIIEKLNRRISQINDEYVCNLAMSADYCVIDTTTQTILKNTTREPELLVDGENTEYAYYLVLYYDQNGRLSNFRVKGSNTEQFFKNVQLVANSSGILGVNDINKSAQYRLIDDEGETYARVTVTQKNPQNAVFIYAMTSEQIEHFSWMTEFASSSGAMIVNSTRENLYDVLGIGNLYLAILCIIAVLLAVTARCRPHLTADTAGSRLPAEVIFLMLFMLSIGLHMNVVEEVYYVSEVVGMTEGGIFCVAFAAMAVLFGVWYWGLLSVRELFMDSGTFVTKRSLIYRYWNQIKAFCSRVWGTWKAALTIEGLDKDVVKPLKRMVTVLFVLGSLACCCWFFGIFIFLGYSALLYLWLKRYANKIQMQYNCLLEATNAIAQGRFDNPLTEDFGIFERYKNELSQIQDGFGKAVEEEVRSQRMKTELITNVSHDLKTPLTAIITYVDLLKEDNVTPEQQKSYLDTLERKSLRLKVLIEDLFEISKASSGNVRFYPVAVDICNLMRQVYLEHEQQMIENGLDVRFDLPEEKLILQLDSQKTYRIFENLYVNVTKYALPNTRVYVQARVIIIKEGMRTVHIEMKNISAQELTVTPTDLTERFVRGDASRNTEGSGLGLAIAKSFSELQGGRFYVEIDGDLFKAVLEWDT